jgi:hypothetical protein
MKSIDKNNHRGLVEELQVISGKKFTEDQFARLYEGLQKIDWTKACQIVREFERLERFPPNVYGVISNRIEDQFRADRQGHYKTAQWNASDADCATPEEWKLFFEITSEILLWHRIGLAKRNPNGITIPMSSDEWVQAGCPPTWSNLLDHFLTGLIMSHNREPEKREAFLSQYLEILKSERDKRIINKPEPEEVFA